MIYMKKEDKTKSLLIRLTPSEHRRLKIEAIERNLTVTDLIRMSLRFFIDQYDVKKGNK